MQTSKQEQINELLASLNREELLMLLESVAQQLHRAEHPPQALYGVWKGRFPEDADIDDALREIRHQWKTESEDTST